MRKYFLPEKQATLNLFTDSKEKVLNLPSHHDIKFSKRINFQTLQRAYEIQPESYENLLSVKGVGPATRNKLLKHFGSVEGIKKASEQDISQIVGKKLAKMILQGLHNQELSIKKKN